MYSDGGPHVVAFRASATAAQILIDPANPTSTEVTVNANGTVQLKPQVLDSAGNIIENAPLSYSSISPDIATVDAAGRIEGKSPGFSTLAVTSGAVLATTTITVVAITSGVAGFEITGVAQDLARRIYLANSRDHTILLSQDLQQSPSIYAGANQQPGLINADRQTSRFRNPAFLAFNQAEGSLYVSDSANNVIRQIRPGPNGQVQTLDVIELMGIFARSATFNNPQGIALDNQGFLWVVDSGNHTVRRINLVTRIVKTIAGKAGRAGSSDGAGESAGFNSPTGIAIESESLAQQLERQERGDPPPPLGVIVADTGNGLIRRVKENGQVETIGITAPSAGGIDSQHESPLQEHPASSTPSIAHSSSILIYRRASASSPGTAVTFNSPTAVATDSFGNIYVTESNSGRVKTVLPNGQVVLSAQVNTFREPKGIAIGQSGKVLVAETGFSAREITFGVPEVSSLTPQRVSIRGGARITIKGRNFAPGTVIVAAGAVISNIEVKDTQTISFVTPPLPSGRITLTVQNRGGLAQTLLLVEGLSPSDLPPGYITTIAGGSTFGGEGSKATAASISPAGVAVDVDGNIFIADISNNRIRRVDAKTGIITAVAGNGENDFYGDGGLATAAALEKPRAIAFDDRGNLYIAHGDNTRIRKVDVATGIITTMAGGGPRSPGLGDNGPAAGAYLSVVQGLAFDAAGNLLVADSFDHRVRKIDRETRIVTTVAGSGPPGESGGGFAGDGGRATVAALNLPTGVAVDSAGNIFIADRENNRIRKVDTASGIITTVAGSGPAGSQGISSGDGGAAISATLIGPYAIAFDANGSLYISGNSRIRKVDAGIITTVAGNGRFDQSAEDGPATAGTLIEPDGIAVDAARNLFIADLGSGRIRKVDSAARITTVAGGGKQDVGDNGPGTFAALRFPNGVGVDAARNLFVADTQNHRVRKVSAATGVITTIAGNGENEFSGDGGQAVSAGLSFPTAISVDTNGALFIADTANRRVRKVDARTQIITTIAGTGESGFSGDNGLAIAATLDPHGIAVDAAGNIYIADADNHRIRRVDATTGIITSVAGNGGEGFLGDNGLATDANLFRPQAVALDARGNLFIADSGNHRIRKVAAGSRIITTVAGGGKSYPGDNGLAVNAVLGFPRGIAVDAAGNLFTTDSNNDRIRRVDAFTGIITTVAGAGQAGFSGDGGPATDAAMGEPYGVAVDAAGNLYIADPFNNRIRLVRGLPARRRP